MVYKVLVVDDSHFFQMRLKEIINEHPELEVIGIAANGREAIELAERLQPDIISMDYEMPQMDGVTAVRAIMAKKPVPIVMFSSMTYEGAKITLDALDAGAVDFIPKNFAEVSRNSKALKNKLHETLINFARQAKPRVIAPLPQSVNTTQKSPAPHLNTQTANTHTQTAKTAAQQGNVLDDGLKKSQAATTPTVAAQKSLRGRIKILAIGASTGGPVAVSEILQKLPANFSLPIVIIQHMPENFTKAFADRLNKLCALNVCEAKDGDSLEPGKALIAPGGNQLLLDRRGFIKILPGDSRMNYRPSVDITFASAANIYGDATLGIVLTGMGADGCDGARLIKERGGVIWGQDQASCVVYGMPKAIATAGLTDQVITLANIAPKLLQDF